MLRAILDRPVSVVIATLALTVIGAVSLLRLPVSLLPTLERPRLHVTARDDDRSREELLERVAEPLERRFMSLAGVVQVTTTVADGHCRLTLETEWQTDVDRLRIDAERRLADVSGLDLDTLEITVEAGDWRPILEVAVTGGRSAHARTVFAEEVLVPELGRLRGAGRVRRHGGALARPVVRPHAAALAARGLTASDVVARLRDLGQSRPVGRLRDGGRVRPLAVRESVGSLTDLSALRLGDGATALGDVADVALEVVPDDSVYRWNGEDAVLVELHRAPGANAVLLAREARRALAGLEERAGDSLAIAIAGDASLEVVDALARLALAGLLGLALGTVVLRWMLGSWRPTLALVTVVPASLLAAFSGFHLWGVSLDIVSLAGLALAAGMLVDNSIVVLEAVEGARARRRDDAAYRGTRQIALALLAGFLTTAVVFVPLIYLRGLARAFFGVQAFAIVTTLVISLALSLTLTPVLAQRIGGRAARGRHPGLRFYRTALDRALARPAGVIAATLALLAIGAVLATTLPRELVPRGTSRTLTVDFRLPPSLDRRETARRVAEIERRLAAAAGEVEAMVVLYRGRDEPLGDDAEGRCRLELRLADASSLGAKRRSLEREILRLPGVAAEIRLRRGAVAAALERSKNRVELEASAATPRRAERLAERLARLIDERLDVAAWRVRDGVTAPRPAFVLRWRDFRFAEMGTGPEPLTRQVRDALGGFFAGRADLGGVRSEILVDTTRPSDPALVPVRPQAAGEAPEDVVPLAALAEVEKVLERPPLERRDGRPAVRLALAPDQVTPDRLAALVTGLPLAVDEEVRLVGEARELRRSFRQLRWTLALGLLLVFLTVAALYESIAMPVVVMTTVPVAAAGAVGLLWLTGQSLNLMSFLGLILLAGIVVNNAIVLVHRIEQRLAGDPPATAIRAAAAERYRPILMTTLTTLLGMLPLAALGGEGVELRRALALAVVGGLVTSLFAALFVVPVLHQALVRRAPR